VTSTNLAREDGPCRGSCPVIRPGHARQAPSRSAVEEDRPFALAGGHVGSLITAVFPAFESRETFGSWRFQHLGPVGVGWVRRGGRSWSMRRPRARELAGPCSGARLSLTERSALSRRGSATGRRTTYARRLCPKSRIRRSRSPRRLLDLAVPAKAAHSGTRGGEDVYATGEACHISRPAVEKKEPGPASRVGRPSPMLHQSVDHLLAPPRCIGSTRKLEPCDEEDTCRWRPGASAQAGASVGRHRAATWVRRGGLRAQPGVRALRVLGRWRCPPHGKLGRP